MSDVILSCDGGCSADGAADGLPVGHAAAAVAARAGDP